MDLPIKNGVFHSYVSLPEGRRNKTQETPAPKTSVSHAVLRCSGVPLELFPVVDSSSRKPWDFETRKTWWNRPKPYQKKGKQPLEVGKWISSCSVASHANMLLDSVLLVNPHLINGVMVINQGSWLRILTYSGIIYTLVGTNMSNCY